jgi:hypothetical protein
MNDILWHMIKSKSKSKSSQKFQTADFFALHFRCAPTLCLSPQVVLSAVDQSKHPHHTGETLFLPSTPISQSSPVQVKFETSYHPSSLFFFFWRRKESGVLPPFLHCNIGFSLLLSRVFFSGADGIWIVGCSSHAMCPGRQVRRLKSTLNIISERLHVCMYVCMG